MIEKDQIRSVMEALDESDDPELVRSFLKSGCKAPLKVIYLVFANCVTINNGACPDWDFCDPVVKFKK
ncbi:MAG: hypothetical protein AB1402_08670 [Bacillota bacterium]|jgi:hypothetical protein